MDGFKQLVQWSERKYFITLEFTPGQGWFCSLSSDGRYGEPIFIQNNSGRIRAMSQASATPQEAISNLLSMVQP